MNASEAPHEKEALVSVTVTYKESNVTIGQQNVVVESITYQIARNPSFNPVYKSFFSWQGHGPGTGIKSPGGASFNTDFAGGANKWICRRVHTTFVPYSHIESPEALFSSTMGTSTLSACREGLAARLRTFGQLAATEDT